MRGYLWRDVELNMSPGHVMQKAAMEAMEDVNGRSMSRLSRQM